MLTSKPERSLRISRPIDLFSEQKLARQEEQGGTVENSGPRVGEGRTLEHHCLPDCPILESMKTDDTGCALKEGCRDSVPIGSPRSACCDSNLAHVPPGERGQSFNR